MVITAYNKKTHLLFHSVGVRLNPDLIKFQYLFICNIRGYYFITHRPGLGLSQFMLKYLTDYCRP